MAQLGCRCTQGLWFKGWGIVSSTLLRPNKAWHWPLMCHCKPEVMGAAWLRDSLSSVFFQLLFTDPLLYIPLVDAWECLRFTSIWFNGRWKSKAWAEGTQHPWEHGLTSCFMTPNGFVNTWIIIVFTVSYAFDFLLINMLNICVSGIQMPLKIQLKRRTRLICLTFEILNYCFKQENLNFGLCKNTYFHNCPY